MHSRIHAIMVMAMASWRKSKIGLDAIASCLIGLVHGDGISGLILQALHPSPGQQLERSLNL